jgi:hypothetical protein
VDISVVIAVYNEEEALPPFHRALAGALDRLRSSLPMTFDRRVEPGVSC